MNIHERFDTWAEQILDGDLLNLPFYGVPVHERELAIMLAIAKLSQRLSELKLEAKFNTLPNGFWLDENKSNTKPRK